MIRFTKQELFIFIGLILLGFILLAYRLDTIPAGLHGDEAVAGLEARRFLKEGTIEVWSKEVNGSPSLAYYLSALFFKIFGESIYSLRLSHSLFAAISIPFFYLTVRLIFFPSIAIIATFLLTTSDLFLAFSRRADNISVNFFFFPTLFFFLYFFKTNKPIYLILSGISLGLTHYTYFQWIIPFIFILLLFVKITIKRKTCFIEKIKSILIFLGCYLLIAFPILIYSINHLEDVTGRSKQTSIFSSQGLTHARTYIQGNPNSFGVLLYNAKNTILMFNILPEADIWNSFRYKPVFDPVTGLFFIIGLLLGLKYLKKNQTGFLYFLFFFFLLPSLITIDSPSFRRSQTSIYLAYMFVGLGITEIIRLSQIHLRRLKKTIEIFLFLTVLTIGIRNTALYFTNYAVSPEIKIRFNYSQVKMADYIRSLPKSTHIYFYSLTATFNHETFKFLLPDAVGEDRSKEFGKYSLVKDIIDKDVVYILTTGYLDKITELENLYPGGKRIDHKDSDGTILFITYFLPAISQITNHEI